MSPQTRTQLSAGVLAAALACAHAPPPPPIPFVDSAAFAAIRSRTYAILVRDLNGDGLEDAVIGQKVASGWAPVVYMHERSDAGDRWVRTCEGLTVEGAELETLRWLEMRDGPLVLLVGREENPDELIQSVALVDPSAACEPRLEDRMVLTKTIARMVAPSHIPVGVQMRDDGRLLRLTDRPRILHLEGIDGPVDLLTGIRVRSISGTRSEPEVEEHTPSLLTRRELRATFRVAGRDPVSLIELADGDDATAFALRERESGLLELAADGPMVALEVRHGCSAAQPSRVSLAVAEQGSHRLGEQAVAGSFVLAVGRSQVGATGVRRDLIALRHSLPELVLSIESSETPTCVREILAYGFVIP